MKIGCSLLVIVAKCNSRRGFAPRTSVASCLQSNSRTCRRSEIAMISRNDNVVMKVTNIKNPYVRHHHTYFGHVRSELKN